MKHPNLFLVGAPKCGTTALYRYLEAHPGVFWAGKEINHFCTDLHFGQREGLLHFRDDTEYLERMFSDTGEAQVVGDASVWYLYSLEAAERIRAFAPEARILIMLRDPIDMLASLHAHLVHDGDEPERDFERALALSEERRTGRLPKHPDRLICPIEAYQYLEIARYAGQVERYFQVFGREQVMVIHYRDFSYDTQGCYRKVLDFLALDPPPRLPEFRRINASRRPRSLLLWHLRHFAPESVRQLWRHLLPATARDRALRTLGRLNRVEDPPQPLSPALRGKLRAALAEDVRQLEQLVGWETGWHG